MGLVADRESDVPVDQVPSLLLWMRMHGQDVALEKPELAHQRGAAEA
jgi:hypothetical protein